MGMDRRGFILAAAGTLSAGTAGCLFGDGNSSADREELAEYVTFEHWFVEATTGMDLRMTLENQTDRDLDVLAVPEFYIGDEEVSADSRNASLPPEGSGEVTIPILLGEGEADDVTRYVLSLTVYDGQENLAEYEEEFEDFQDRVES